MALTPPHNAATIFPMKSATDYNSEFTNRVRELREAAQLTQHQMADALGVPFERYRKYEQKIMMPHRLLNRFALIVRADLEYLITGHTKGRERNRA